MWAKEAVPFLWSLDPPLDALLALERPHRLQHYANSIKTLGRSISVEFLLVLSTPSVKQTQMMCRLIDYVAKTINLDSLSSVIMYLILKKL